MSAADGVAYRILRSSSDDEDHVGGVLHQGAEQRLAALAGHLLGEREPLDGQRRLPGQDLKHRGEVAEGPPVAEEPDKADERVADGPVLEGERAEQRALWRLLAAGRPAWTRTTRCRAWRT